MKIKCVVACQSNASGKPSLVAVIIECSQAQYDDGLHYEKAMRWAKNNHYEGEMVTFDENDGPKFLFRTFIWNGVDIVAIEETPAGSN